jgi:hypothetical protein
MLGKLHIKGGKEIPINICPQTLCFRGTAKLSVDPGLLNLTPFGFYLWGS